MKTTTKLFAACLAAATTLFATPALASDCYHHAQAAGPMPAYGGRYVTRVENQWVDGRYEQRWVEGQCVTRHKNGRKHRVVTRCAPGRYEQVWVPGHFEPVTRTVWVPRYASAQVYF